MCFSTGFVFFFRIWGVKLRRTPPLRAWSVFSKFPGLGLRDVVGFREAVGSFLCVFFFHGVCSCSLKWGSMGGGLTGFHGVSWGFMGLFMGVFGFVKSSRVFLFWCVCVCACARGVSLFKGFCRL